MAKLAFYRGKYGTIWDKFICLVTGSEFSHVELCFQESVGNIGRCWSSSTYDNGVRQKWLSFNEKWVLVDLPSEVSEQLFIQENGKLYDYVGLLGTIVQSPWFSRQRKWFCSEIVAEALGLKDSWKYSPEDLHQKYVQR